MPGKIVTSGEIAAAIATPSGDRPGERFVLTCPHKLPSGVCGWVFRFDHLRPGDWSRGEIDVFSSAYVDGGVFVCGGCGGEFRIAPMPSPPSPYPPVRRPTILIMDTPIENETLHVELLRGGGASFSLVRYVLERDVFEFRPFNLSGKVAATLAEALAEHALVECVAAATKEG